MAIAVNSASCNF